MRIADLGISLDNDIALNGALITEGLCTVAGGVSVFHDVRMGLFSYLSAGVHVEDAVIGRYCSIAEGVTIGLSSHPLTFLTTHPVASSRTDTLFDNHPIAQAAANILYEGHVGNGPVTIGNDVWIGCNAIIKKNVRIGNGAVIGAGAVVTKDVGPYEIVGGVPAKLIRKRFTDRQIEQLEKLQWWDYDLSQLTAEEKKAVYENVDATLDLLPRLIGQGRAPRIAVPNVVRVIKTDGQFTASVEPNCRS